MGSDKSCRHQRDAERTASAALPRMRKTLELSLVGDASLANQRDCGGGLRPFPNRCCSKLSILRGMSELKKCVLIVPKSPLAIDSMDQNRLTWPRKRPQQSIPKAKIDCRGYGHGHGNRFQGIISIAVATGVDTTIDSRDQKRLP